MGVEALGDLIVNVGVDTTGLGQGLDSAASQVKQAANDMASELDGLDGAIKHTDESMTQAWMDLGDGSAKLDELAKSLKSAGDEMKKAGEALTVGLTVPLAALGAAALAAAADFDTAFKEIDRQAGGTAEELAGMKEAFTNIFSTLPVSAHDAAAAIGEISDRLGLVGKPLEEMSTQMLNLARITHEQVVPLIESTTRAFGQWDIATEKQARALDTLFTAVQTTGGSVSKMSQELTTFGPALREMGFSFEQATALIAKFEQQGVNTSATLTGLRQALLRLGKAGIEDPAQGLQVLIQMIKDAGSAGEANAIGLKAFGRGASDLVDAIRRGKLDVADFVAQLEGSTQTINEVANRTTTLSERFTLLKNELETALKPLGDSLLRILEGVLQGMQPVIAIVGELAQAFASLSPTTQAVILGLAGIVAAIGPLVAGVGLFSNGLAAILSFAGTVTTALGGLAGVLTTVATIAGVAAAAFAGWKLGEWLKNNLGDVQDLSYGMGVQLAGAIHNATTSSADFKKAMGDATAAAKGFGADGHKASQTADEIRAALDRLVNGAEKVATAVKAIPFKDIASPELLAGIKAVTDAHNKAFEAIVKADETILKERADLGDLAKGMSDAEVVATATQQAFDNVTQSMHNQLDTIQRTGSVWKDMQSTLETIVSAGVVGELNRGVERTNEAFKELGIQSHTSIQQMIADFDLLSSKGLLTAKESLTSMEKILQEQIEASKNAGEQISTDQLLALAKVKLALQNFGKDPVWESVSSVLNTAFKALSDGITKSIFDFKHFGQNMLAVLKQVGEAIVKEIIDKLILSKSNLDALTKSMTDFLRGAFGDGASAAGKVSTGLPNDVVPGGIPGTPGAGAGGAGGAAKAVGGLTGMLTMVGSVVGAISSIIGNFQMAHIETTLKAIEHETARMAIYIGDQSGNSVQFYTGKTFEWLKYIKDLLGGFILADLDDIKGALWAIRDTLKADLKGASGQALSKIANGAVPPSAVLNAPFNGGGSVVSAGSGSTYYVAITDVDMKKLLDDLINMMQLRGLKV